MLWVGSNGFAMAFLEDLWVVTNEFPLAFLEEQLSERPKGYRETQGGDSRSTVCEIVWNPSARLRARLWTNVCGPDMPFYQSDSGTD